MNVRQTRKASGSQSDDRARRETWMVAVYAAILVACILIVLIAIQFELGATLG